MQIMHLTITFHAGAFYTDTDQDEAMDSGCTFLVILRLEVIKRRILN